MNTVLLFGFASFYLWFLLARASILDPILLGARSADGFWGDLIRCPFCAGFWITGALLLVTGNYDPITHLATASVVGCMGALTA